MTATILATCAGWVPSARADVEFSPLQRYAVELAGVTGRAPRVVYVNTAGGDQRHLESQELAAARLAGVDARHLRLFGRTTEPLEEILRSADVVWVNGGSVVNLLATWRAHGLDALLHAAWADGVVLAGTSAGAVCWHVGGPTSSFGPQLDTVTDALAMVPHSVAVHFDSQPRRRPLFHESIGSGELPGGFGLEEGTGILYRGTEPVEFLTESDSATVVRVERDAGGVVREERLEATRRT